MPESAIQTLLPVKGAASNLRVLVRAGGIASTNCFLIVDERTRQAVMFDAPNDTTAPLLDLAKREGWDVVGLWLTHGHFDHLADHAVVKSRFPAAKIVIHELEAPKLQRPQDPRHAYFTLPFEIPPGEPDELVRDGEELAVGKSTVRAIHTPGHAPGHVVYFFPEEKLLVGGDLILMHSVGRTDLPDSDEDQLRASLKRVMELPHDTRLLPGHGPSSTLAEELQNNPYIQDAL